MRAAGVDDDGRDAIDLLIVGAGSAGSVIAARVSERGDRRVVLLEAGADYPDPARLPADLADGTRNSMHAHDWGFTHRRSTTRWLAQFPMPRGRVVGGSSAVNTCIAVRPQPRDLEEWVARGLPEWSWAQCLPALCRLERDLDFGDAPYHGSDGPLPIRRHPPDELVEWQQAFLDACATLGLPPCPDENAPDSHGYGPHAMNKDCHGRRLSAAECWLTPEVRARDNLELRPHTLARRVVFEGRRAVGVEVEHQGRVSTLRARRIVLCAGALATPGLLLRSGIGPRRELARLGVEERADLPAVGAQLLDHPGYAVFFRLRRGARSSIPAPRLPLVQTVLRYGARDSGWSNDMYLQAGSRVPIYLGPVRDGGPLVSIMGHIGKPLGVGHLRWPSAHPHARPEIESRLLDHPVDRARAVDAMLLAGRLAETPPMRKLARHFLPGRHVLRRASYLDKVIRMLCDSGYHPSGTVPMGADGDPRAALDGRGRVRGVDGLYVADASVMPTIPAANINLTVLMIGERVGEWLRDD